MARRKELRGCFIKILLESLAGRELPGLSLQVLQRRDGIAQKEIRALMEVCAQ
jgi:hypothetical protein